MRASRGDYEKDSRQSNLSVRHRNCCIVSFTTYHCCDCYVRSLRYNERLRKSRKPQKETHREREYDREFDRECTTAAEATAVGIPLCAGCSCATCTMVAYGSVGTSTVRGKRKGERVLSLCSRPLHFSSSQTKCVRKRRAWR